MCTAYIFAAQNVYLGLGVAGCVLASRWLRSHTVEHDPSIKSQLATMQLTSRPHVMQIWSRNLIFGGQRNPRRPLCGFLKIEATHEDSREIDALSSPHLAKLTGVFSGDFPCNMSRVVNMSKVSVASPLTWGGVPLMSHFPHPTIHTVECEGFVSPEFSRIRDQICTT